MFPREGILKSSTGNFHSGMGILADYMFERHNTSISIHNLSLVMLIGAFYLAMVGTGVGSFAFHEHDTF